MCVTRVRTYVYPDGRKEVIESPEYCPRSNGNQPCKNHRRREYAEQAIASTSSAIGPPSLDDEVTTPSSGSFPPTPVSATSGGPRLELRRPSGSGSSKGKERARRSVDVRDLRLDIGSTRRESSSRSGDERTKSARFADEASEGSTVRPDTPSRRGRGDQPSPSILRSPAPVGSGSPRTRRTPTEVHQPNPPFQPAGEGRRRPPTPGLHLRTNTAPAEISRPSSTGATVGSDVDADIFTRPDARAQARAETQRQERERRRHDEERRRNDEERRRNDEERRRNDEERARRYQQRQQEDADRRFAEQLERDLNLNAQRRARQTAAAADEARESAEDDYSLREYQRINSREALREAQRRQQAERDRLAREIRERTDREQEERIAREVVQERGRRSDAARREVEEEIGSPRATIGYEAERRRDSRLQEAVSQMTRQNAEGELIALQREIQRLTNEIEYNREARRVREREDGLAAQRRRLEELEAEVALLEENDREIAKLEEELRELERVRSQRSSWYGSPARYSIGPGPSYGSSTPPMSLSSRRPSSGGSGNVALQARSPVDDPDWRRWRGEEVLRQSRAIASARDSALEMQRAVSDEDAYRPGGRGGLGRRNTVGGGGRARGRRGL